MEKRNSQLEHGQPMEQTRMRLGCCSVSITTPVSLLANEFDVRSVLGVSGLDPRMMVN